MSTSERILQTLENHCKQRGAAAQLSRDLNVAKSTVTRWLEEKTIPDAMQTLLAWYLLGESPPSFKTKFNLQTSLVFDDAEWRIISILAKREGITEAQWITSRIRAYLAYTAESKDTGLKVAEDEAPYGNK